MKKKAIAVIPILARRRRRNQAERGAKIGAPALLALVGGAVAFIVRRRKRKAAGFDASPSELGGTAAGGSATPGYDGSPPPVSETPAGAAASTDGDAADAPGTGEGRPSTLEGDPADSVPVAGAGGAGGETVVPDTSTDDPAVVDAEKAAAAEAGSIGGDVPATPPSAEDDFGTDPATRPVEEHSGSAYESFSERES